MLSIARHRRCLQGLPLRSVLVSTAVLQLHCAAAAEPQLRAESVRDTACDPMAATQNQRELRLTQNESTIKTI